MKTKSWPYDLIADIYDYDIGANMPFNDISCYLKLMGKREKGQLLEIGAGTGRLTLDFLAANWSVLAVDRSKKMLSKLEVKVDKTPYFKKLQTIVSRAEDLTDLPEEFFDIVIFPYCVICYITNSEDLMTLLERIHKSLKKDGLIIIDAFIPKISSIPLNNYHEDYQRKTPIGMLMRMKRITCDIEPEINLVERKYSINSKVIETKSFIKPYFPKQLLGILSNLNYNPIETIYDYKQATVSPDTQFFTIKAAKFS